MIKKYFSDLQSEFKNYRAATFKQDVFAGITVTAVALPLALAFGVASGASASSGLITAILAGLVIGTLSGGAFQISGPTGAMSAILISLVARYGLYGIWLAGVLSGALLVVAGIFKLGKFVSLIPAPVVTGFTSGIALVIAIGQLDNFFGVKMPVTESAVMHVFEYLRAFPVPNPFSLGTALAVIVIMFLWRAKWSAVIPSSLAALIIVSAAAALFHFPVDVIGSIPKTLLPAQRLLPKDLLQFNTLKSLAVPAISIAALGMIESLLCGEVASRMKGKEYDANRDLVAQGIGNMLIPFFGGVPATAAIARTSVGIKAGGETRLVSIIHACGLLLTIFLLAPIMSRIPVAALAGILIVTAIRMNDWDAIRYFWKYRFKASIFEFLITMAATVVLDLTYAIIIGIIVSLIIFVFQVSKVNIIEHHIETTPIKKPLSAPKDFLNGIKFIHFSGPLYFATASKLRAKIKNDSSNFHTMIISLRDTPFIDTTGIQIIDDIRLDLLTKNCKLKIIEVQPAVEKMFNRSDFITKIGSDSLFESAEAAIISLTNSLNV